MVLIVGLLAFFFILPRLLDRFLNTTANPPPYPASVAAQALHRQLLIADLHADSLLWSRDLLKRGRWGHVDVPRLIEGNVALQTFTAVTKVPWGVNIESNDGNSDYITLLAITQCWPLASFTSRKERAIYQARRLHEFAANSHSRLTIIKTRKDLEAYLARREKEPYITAGLLGIEGAHALDGDVNNLDLIYEAGFRMIGLTHLFDNEMAGSVHGMVKGGLTAAGKEMIGRMEIKRMLVDLAHASPQAINDVLLLTRRPVFVSHTGVKGTCNNMRNLSDDQLKKIAKTGGLVGIGFWETATCGKDIKAIARAIRYTVNLIGIESVALGSDFDGAVAEPLDTTGLVQITDALLGDGFSTEEIRKLMGGNVIRLFKENLP
jgi:membrane dipeptidase